MGNWNWRITFIPETPKRKPLAWYYHKALCEIGWLFRYRDNFRFYYKHLNKLCKYGFNLYGEPYQNYQQQTKTVEK